MTFYINETSLILMMHVPIITYIFFYKNILNLNDYLGEIEGE